MKPQNHVPISQRVFLLSVVALGVLLITMGVRLGELSHENARLVDELVDEQGRAMYWMEYRSVDAEDGWAAYEQCERDYVAQLEDEHACPNPNDVCGEALDICYSYCMQGQPTVQVEHAMCKAWWTGFIQRESHWRDMRKAHELP